LGRSEREQVLAVKERLAKMLVSIVNLPDEEFPVTANPDEETEVSVAAYRAYRESGKPFPQYQRSTTHRLGLAPSLKNGGLNCGKTFRAKTSPQMNAA